MNVQPGPTPPAVVEAINTVAAYLLWSGHKECRITPTGGCTFALETTTAERERLMTEVNAILEREVNQTRETNRRLNRRSQALESLVDRLQRETEVATKMAEHWGKVLQHNTWKLRLQLDRLKAHQDGSVTVRDSADGKKAMEGGGR